MTRINSMLMMAALVLSVTPSFGQERNIRRVLRFHVKPGMMADFTAAVEADNVAMKKSEHKKRQTWWQSMSGPSEVVLVRYYKSYADLEAGDGTLSTESVSARARVNRLTDSQETTIDEIIPEATFVADRNFIPKFVRTLRTTVKPDKMIEYEAWLKNEIGAAAKKGAIKLYLNSRVRYGTSSNMFISSMGLDSIAMLDDGLPLIKIMTKPVYDAAMVKRSSMILNSEATLYRNLPKLTYFPEAK